MAVYSKIPPKNSKINKLQHSKQNNIDNYVMKVMTIYCKISYWDEILPTPPAQQPGWTFVGMTCSMAFSGVVM